MAPLFLWGAVSAFGAELPKGCEPYRTLGARDPFSDFKERTPTRGIPLNIRGGDEASYQPPVTGAPVHELKRYDAIVVGGGLSGMTAGVYLSDAKASVLMLEKEPTFGGLAAGGERAGFRYARGAAYFSQPDRTAYRIFQHLGLGDYKSKFEITAPVDSYLNGSQFYRDVWEDHAVERLPKSFELFRHAMWKFDERIPSQPIEDSGLLQWDHLTALEWIRAMPAYVAGLKDSVSKRIYREFTEDARLDPRDPMREVIEFVNLYSRSALGFETHRISATAFANFYISEISERFTGVMGSGDIAEKIVSILSERESVVMRASSTVTRIRNLPDGVEVEYLRGGVRHVVRGDKLVFSLPIGLAPKLVEGLDQLAPRHAAILGSLEYAHYSVHNVFVEGHPWRESYDLWFRGPDYNDSDPTDVILGRWQDPRIDGYQGYRRFKKDPKDDFGILTIYHPLPPRAVGSGYSDGQAARQAEYALERTERLLGPLLEKRWGTQIKVKAIETNRWPYSIHIVRPGWLSQATVLREPMGNIHLANNNLGLPSVEEALYRGKYAAEAILDLTGRSAPAAPQAASGR